MKLSLLAAFITATFAAKVFAAASFYAPLWSGDGTKMIIGTDENTIEVFDSAGDKTGEIKTTGQLSNYSISSDGANMFYMAKYEGLVRVDMTTGQKKVLHKGPCGPTSWSPDGKKIIFSVIEVSDNPGKRQAVTYIINADGSNKKEIIRRDTEKANADVLSPGTTTYTDINSEEK